MIVTRHANKKIYYILSQKQVLLFKLALIQIKIISHNSRMFLERYEYFRIYINILIKRNQVKDLTSCYSSCICHKFRTEKRKPYKRVKWKKNISLKAKMTLWFHFWFTKYLFNHCVLSTPLPSKVNLINFQSMWSFDSEVIGYKNNK